MGWLIALAVLILLGCLPLGVKAIYSADGPLVALIIGPVRVPIFPVKEKTEKKAKPKKEEKKEAPKEKKKNPEEKKGGSWTDFLPFVSMALDFLGDFRRKLRINRLELNLCMAGSDPCDLAINYGKAWAAVGNLMPLLEQVFVIKKRNVNVACDFTQTETTVYVRADITITVARILGLVLRYGWRALKELIKIIMKRNGGASK